MMVDFMLNFLCLSSFKSGRGSPTEWISAKVGSLVKDH